MSASPTYLGSFGAFTFVVPTPDEAAELEQLGYGTLWIGGSPSADLDFAEPILAATDTLTLATGVVNIWTAPAKQVADSFHRINAAHPGRFLLGVGAGHREHTTEYAKPFGALASYLDDLDHAEVPASQRILAALGPKVLRMSAERSAGAHPALTPTSYNRIARAEMGDGPLLAPIQPVLVDGDVAAAHLVGRQFTDVYFGLRNYVNNWRRLGYTDEDLNPPGSDRFVEDLLAFGTPDQVAVRLREHLDTGADHVAIQVLGAPEQLLPRLRQLAEPLGLRT